MKTVYQQINDVISKHESQVSACFACTDEMIEEIFTAGVYHGLFEKNNHGFYDRKNSVYNLIGTLFELNK